MSLVTLACAVCMGASDSKIAPAQNGAIFLLLGCVGGMLGCISAVGWSIVRRSRQHAEEDDHHLFS